MLVMPIPSKFGATGGWYLSTSSNGRRTYPEQPNRSRVYPEVDLAEALRQVTEALDVSRVTLESNQTSD